VVISLRPELSDLSGGAWLHPLTRCGLGFGKQNKRGWLRKGKAQ
jgi:hypothetical protein